MDDPRRAVEEWARACRAAFRHGSDIIKEQLASADAQALRKKRSTTDCVFPAPRGSRASMAGAAAAKAIKKAEVKKRGVATILGVPPFTPHDLRRTAATHMEEIGISPFIIGHVLNHVSATKASITCRVYARYTYEGKSARRWTCGRIDLRASSKAKPMSCRCERR